MSRESIASVALILLPLALTALAALAAWGTRAVTRLIKDRRVALALEVIANGAAAIVADLAQHVVVDLKDPSKPGAWSSVAAATVRVRAVERVKQLYPQAVALAQEALANPDRINDLLGTVVEKAVVELKTKAPAQLTAAETLPLLAADPVALGRETLVPPEPSAPVSIHRATTLPMGAPSSDDGQRGSISLRALLALVVIAAALGAALAGCPNWQRPACPTPGRWSCVADQPHYCSPTRELTPIGDEPCGAQGRVCEVRADGVGRCAPRVADAGTDASVGD